MFEVSLVFRGGIPAKLKENIDEMIEDLSLQDNVFVTDTNKSHTLDLVITDINHLPALVKRIQGAHQLTLVAGNYVGATNARYVAVLGKVGSSAIQKSIQTQLGGLF